VARGAALICKLRPDLPRERVALARQLAEGALVLLLTDARARTTGVVLMGSRSPFLVLNHKGETHDDTIPTSALPGV